MVCPASLHLLSKGYRIDSILKRDKEHMNEMTVDKCLIFFGRCSQIVWKVFGQKSTKWTMSRWQGWTHSTFLNNWDDDWTKSTSIHLHPSFPSTPPIEYGL